MSALALINTPVYEEAMDDINNIIFNIIDINSVASAIYDQLEQAAIGGATEEWLYREMSQLIREAQDA